MTNRNREKTSIGIEIDENFMDNKERPKPW